MIVMVVDRGFKNHMVMLNKQGQVVSEVVLEEPFSPIGFFNEDTLLAVWGAGKIYFYNL